MTPPVPFPYGYPPPRRAGTADVVATVVLGTLAGIAGLLAVYLSVFFVMAGDSCGANDCQESFLIWAYLVTWGGIGLAGLIAIVGIVLARRRGRPMWIWPALALLLVPAALVAGGLLASQIVRR